MLCLVSVQRLIFSTLVTDSECHRTFRARKMLFYSTVAPI